MTAITTAAHIDAQTQEDLMRQAGIWIEHSTLIEDDLPARPLAAVQAEKHHLDRYTQLVADRAAARGSKCLAQIEEPAGAASAAVAPQGEYPPLPIAVGSPAWKAVREQERERLRLLAEQPAAVAGPAIDLAEVDLPDVEDMAHSAVQEALSFGVNHDVFHRWMRAVMDKTVQALATAPVAAPALEAPAAPADGATPGPWFVRKREVNGELRDCFVAAPDCQGLAYDACILCDDEYHDGMGRKLADCELIVAAVNQHRAALAAAPQAPAAPVHSKTYSDGTVATGSGELPAQSPQQQVLCTLLDTVEAMLGGANGPTIQIRAALLAAPAAPAVDAPEPASEWRDIFTAEKSDDLIWLYDANSKTIDGPRTFGTYDVEEYTHWAPAEAPDLDGVDEAFAAAIAAQAKEGGAAC